MKGSQYVLEVVRHGMANGARYWQVVRSIERRTIELVQSGRNGEIEELRRVLHRCKLKSGELPDGPGIKDRLWRAQGQYQHWVAWAEVLLRREAIQADADPLPVDIVLKLAEGENPRFFAPKYDTEELITRLAREVLGSRNIVRVGPLKKHD
ncbi:hypothetical protein vBSlqSZDD2_39 [Serratia phage vB_SlqS_ZDD2]|nr:hypothetical protein vBSlqSZDD2_39 [Serratia phage vB_SlqS_ZDD2]